MTSIMADTRLTEGTKSPKSGWALVKSGSLLVLPAIVFMLAFYIVPIGKLIEVSFRASDGNVGFSLSAYASVLTSRRFLLSLERTLRISAIATSVTLLIALPIALSLIGAGRRTRTFVLVVTFVSLSA